MDAPRPEGLAERTRRFALAVVRLYASLPTTTISQVLGKQLLRSGTSVGAHYREARRAKSAADFISKIEGALQELDESAFWLELIHDAAITRNRAVQQLASETDELLAIFVTVAKRAKLASDRT